MDPKKEAAREKAREIAERHLSNGDDYGWFDELYSVAEGNIDNVPWADLAPNRFLVEWNEARGKLTDGSGRALVVGCGLGDDAVFLADLGFKVTAFDVSPTAIDWARKVYPDRSIEFVTADLFSPPENWIGAFDLVLEVYTVQALPLHLREHAIDAICGFVADGGELVVVSRWGDEERTEGPPWGLSESDLGLFGASGFRRESIDEYHDDEDDVVRFVAHFKHRSPA